MRSSRPAFRKPPQATPIKLGKVYRRKQQRTRWLSKGKTVVLTAGVAGAVFAAGMVVTNWSVVRAAITGSDAATLHFSNCGFGRRNCVIDGDTFRIDGRKVRIADIDTPEISDPKCPSEYERGMQAKARLRELLNVGPIELAPIVGRDKDRFGRELRVVLRDGRSLGDQLVSEGLARTWTGRREPWC